MQQEHKQMKFQVGDRVLWNGVILKVYWIVPLSGAVMLCDPDDGESWGAFNPVRLAKHQTAWEFNEDAGHWTLMQ